MEQSSAKLTEIFRIKYVASLEQFYKIYWTIFFRETSSNSVNINLVIQICFDVREEIYIYIYILHATLGFFWVILNQINEKSFKIVFRIMK